MHMPNHSELIVVVVVVVEMPDSLSVARCRKTKWTSILCAAVVLISSDSGRSRNGGIIAIMQDGATVSLEPGGQFELSSVPLEDIHACQREQDLHLEQIIHYFFFQFFSTTQKRLCRIQVLPLLQVNIVGKELELGFWGNRSGHCGQSDRVCPRSTPFTPTSKLRTI